MFPVGHHIYQIHVGILTELFPRLFLAAVCGNGAIVAWCIACHYFVDTGCVYVADGCHACAGHKGETVGGIRSAHAESYHADAYWIHRFGGEAEHVGLSGRTFGYFGDNRAVGVGGATRCEERHRTERGYHNTLEAHVLTDNCFKVLIGLLKFVMNIFTKIAIICYPTAVQLWKK